MKLLMILKSISTHLDISETRGVKIKPITALTKTVGLLQYMEKRLDDGYKPHINF